MDFTGRQLTTDYYRKEKQIHGVLQVSARDEITLGFSVAHTTHESKSSHVTDPQPVSTLLVHWEVWTEEKEEIMEYWDRFSEQSTLHCPLKTSWRKSLSKGQWESDIPQVLQSCASSNLHDQLTSCCKGTRNLPFLLKQKLSISFLSLASLKKKERVHCCRLYASSNFS